MEKTTVATLILDFISPFLDMLKEIGPYGLYCMFNIDKQLFDCTVKLVYRDHPMGQKYVVLIPRSSIYAGSIKWEVYPSDYYSVKCGLTHVAFRAGL